MFINMFLWFRGWFLQILRAFTYVIEHKIQKSRVGEGGVFLQESFLRRS